MLALANSKGSVGLAVESVETGSEAGETSAITLSSAELCSPKTFNV